MYHTLIVLYSDSNKPGNDKRRERCVRVRVRKNMYHTLIVLYSDNNEPDNDKLRERCVRFRVGKNTAINNC